MNPVVSLLLFIFSLYIVSLLAKLKQKKFGDPYKKILRFINWSTLLITVLLLILWEFDIHLSNLIIEIIPFWVFLISSIILFGLIQLTKTEKIFYGIFFYGHLFFTVLLLVPLLGVLMFSQLYSAFLFRDHIWYEDRDVIVTDVIRGALSKKPSPTVYLKKGILSYKYKTDIHTVYQVDSVSLIDLPSGITQVTIYEDSLVHKAFIDQ